MKMVPHNDLETFVPPRDSTEEEGAWKELAAFFSRSSGFVEWRARDDRDSLEFLQPDVETWLQHPAGHWNLSGFWERRVHPEDREAFLRFHRQEALEPGLHKYRYRMIDGADEPVWIEEFSCVRSLSSGGKVIFGLFLDVSREQRLMAEVVQISNFERERLGQDLHDDFCQNLAGIACLSKMLEKQLAHDSPANVEYAAEVSKQINEALSRVRTLSHNLSPLQLEDTDLVGCLEKLVRETESRSGVVCHPEFDPTIVVESAETRKHLFRLTQEAINNAIRHGHATQLTLTLAWQSDSICRLTIGDNGCGFPDRPASSEGLGIRLMKHRCRQFGGTLNLSNGRWGGAIVACTFSNP